jgi:hypothetical protein
MKAVECNSEHSDIPDIGRQLRVAAAAPMLPCAVSLLLHSSIESLLYRLNPEP